jgi:signal transduction histidine kinase
MQWRLPRFLFQSTLLPLAEIAGDSTSISAIVTAPRYGWSRHWRFHGKGNMMKIPDWTPGWIHIPPSAKRDAFLLPALFVFNCFTFSSWNELAHVATQPWLLFMWLYGLAGLLPLAWRDKAPVAVFTTQWVLAMAAWPIITHYDPIVGVPVALYAVAVHRNTKISFPALVASFVPNGLTAAVAFMEHTTLAGALSSFIPNILFLVLLSIGAWGAGRVTQASQRHVQHLEHERDIARDAVEEERRRIARDLHDIVSHAVTVIVLQAAGAARVIDTDITDITQVTQVTQSLRHIETTGKQAMGELRRLLGVLQTTHPARSNAATGYLGPQPGLADLDMLLNSLRNTGMQVSVHVEGTPQDLDPSVDLAAYRIVQEGLTNVLKHAGKDANTQLRLAWQPDNLVIQIDNDTNPAQAQRGQELSTGRGLVGLRERAHTVGGHLTAAPHHQGYRLRATLPLAHTAQPTRPTPSPLATSAAV